MVDLECAGEVRECGKECWSTAGEAYKRCARIKQRLASLRNRWVLFQYAAFQAVMQVFPGEMLAGSEGGTDRSCMGAIGIVAGGQLAKDGGGRYADGGFEQ